MRKKGDVQYTSYGNVDVADVLRGRGETWRLVQGRAGPRGKGVNCRCPNQIPNQINIRAESSEAPPISQ